MARVSKKQEEIKTVTVEEEVKVVEGVVEELADVEDLKTGDVIGADDVEEKEYVSSDTVVICSNYPRNIKYQVPDENGHLTDIVIQGNANHLKGKASGVIPIGKFGVTMGVPKKAWEWIKEHRPDDALIKNGLVFAADTAKVAKEMAKARAHLRHGYEPIDPKKSNASQPLEG